jgi:osmotically-inducible protein OsmY
MPKSPPTYDEILRRTVIEPDSSFRPTPEQMAQGPGFRAMDRDEQQLLDRVRGVLASSGVEVAHVEVEVERDRVTLRGKVSDQIAMTRVPELVRGVDGVHEVIDRLVIIPTA